MRVIIEESDDKISQVIAARIVEIVRDKPHAVLGLATGSSPLGVYRQLALAAKDGLVSFANVSTFNLDEYIGLTNINDSYRHFMDENLFRFLDIKRTNTHFPDPYNPDAYDEIIGKEPIDFQLLGIGADGHIGFNEPGTPFSSKTHIAVLTEKTREDNARFFPSISQVPSKAVTMGLSTILQAKEIVLLATGKNKAEAVKKMMNKENENCPASILLRHKNVTIYLDQEAADQLSSIQLEK